MTSSRLKVIGIYSLIALIISVILLSVNTPIGLYGGTMLFTGFMESIFYDMFLKYFDDQHKRILTPGDHTSQLLEVYRPQIPIEENAFKKAIYTEAVEKLILGKNPIDVENWVNNTIESNSLLK